MEKIIEGVLDSSHPDTIKIVLLRKLIGYVNSLENTDDLADISLKCIVRFCTDSNLSQTLVHEFCSFIKLVISRWSEASLFSVFEKLDSTIHSMNIDYLLCTSVSEIICYIQKLTARLRFISVVRNSNDFISLHSGVQIAVEREFLKDDPILRLQMKEALDSFFANSEFNIDPTNRNSFFNLLFRSLTLLDPKLSLKSFSVCIDNEFAKTLSRYLILMITNQKLSVSDNELTDSLVNKMNTLMSNSLVDTNQEQFHLPLVSVLFELQRSLHDSFSFTKTILGFINNLVENYMLSPESCFAALRRFTVWLSWVDDDDTSPVDIWLIGFTCALFMKFSRYESTSSNFFDQWVDFVNWQLKFVVQLMMVLNTPHESLVYVLVFLLLCGESSTKEERFNIFLQHFAQIIDKYFKLHTQNISSEKYKRMLTLLYMSSRLIHISLSPSVEFPAGFRGFYASLSLIENLKLLRRNFNDETTEDLWFSRSKVYNFEVLVRHGAHAGVHLRKVWSRWTNNYEETPKQYKPMNNFIANNRGLLNVGNTCYANASLQLLYHCFDFRNALNGIWKNSSNGPSSTSLIKTTKANDQIRSDSSTDGSRMFSDNGHVLSANGLLHSHLSSIFRLLDTHQSPSIRDLNQVLTLSQPAHFVAGEQQDAVEYLNHLLDRLHEEEVQLNMQNESFINSVKFSFTNNISESSTAKTIESSSNETVISDRYYKNHRSSIVLNLFGGKLLRHTSCIECKHVSSCRSEEFLCLYLPLNNPKSISIHNKKTNESNELLELYGPDVTKSSRKSEQQLTEAASDLTNLIESHFNQIEHVASSSECESCGKVTIQARRLALQQLSSHVLICLNLFTYCQAKQTSSKIMHRIQIPERLSVSLTSSGVKTNNSDLLRSKDENFQTCLTNDVVGNQTSSSADMTPNVRTYKLQAMILHHGVSIHCGHYTCVARVGMQWILFDDESTHHTTLEEVYSEPLATPYLLLYTQL